MPNSGIPVFHAQLEESRASRTDNACQRLRHHRKFEQYHLSINGGNEGLSAIDPTECRQLLGPTCW